MAFIPVPNGALAELRYTLDGQQVENALWFAFDGTPTAGQLATLAEELWNWWDDQLSTQLSTGIVLREVYCTDQTSASGTAYSFSALPNPAGKANSNAAPNNVSLCVTHRTAARGRSFRGRTYVVGLQSASITQNTVATLTTNSVSAAFDALRDGTTISEGVFSICSRFSGNAPRLSGVLTPVVDSVLRDLQVDSQRRRLPGRGN